MNINSNESIIPLSEIVLSTRIVETVKKYNPNFDEKKYKVVDDGSFKLDDDRLNRIMDGVEKNVILPPINVKPIKFYVPPAKRGKENLLYFTVTNGRHRVAVSLIKGKSHIRSVLHS